ncbi:MAG: SdpI family protein [Propionibacteriaceae bacterium]|nr:SdpI family protein [Propionibacteriaceae bacterium]
MNWETRELVVRLVLAAAMLASGVLLWWSGRAAAAGKLKRNHFSGIRIASTLASEDAWRAGNLRAAPTTLCAAVGSFLGVVSALLPVQLPFAVGGVAAMSLVVLLLVMWGSRVAHRAATKVAQLSGDEPFLPPDEAAPQRAQLIDDDTLRR